MGADLSKVYTETELRQNAIAFDRMDRRELVIPNLAAVTFDLLTLTDRELNGGVITQVGLDCPEWDFFDGGAYLFQVQSVQPTGQLLIQQDGNLVASNLQNYNFRGVGPTEDPTPVYIALKQRSRWSILIFGRAGVPATGFAVANLFIRTKGYLFR